MKGAPRDRQRLVDRAGKRRAGIDDVHGSEPQPFVDLVLVAQLGGREHPDFITAVGALLDFLGRPECFGMIGLAYFIHVRPFEFGLGAGGSGHNVDCGHNRESVSQMTRPIRHTFLPTFGYFQNAGCLRCYYAVSVAQQPIIEGAGDAAVIKVRFFMSTPRTIRLSPEDNVVVAVDQITAGATAAGVTARQRVPRGHKMAIAAVDEGEPVQKYGQTIGFASKPILPGDWVHEHNVALRDFARDYRFAEAAKNDEILPPDLRATFEGYLRPNGKTGTRNYIGILTSVNCSASVAKFIAEEVNRSGILDDHPEIDGAVAFVHGSGCGMAAYGEGWELLRRTQWGYATHPNLGAALMVGLGCEVFQIDRMKEEYGMVEGDHFQTMTIQATGGTKKTVEQGVERIKAILLVAACAKRETRPASEIVLSSAADPTAIPESPQIPRLAQPSTFWSSMAGQPCSPKRRKSMAPSICSRVVQSIAPSGKNSSSASAGGRTTQNAMAVK